MRARAAACVLILLGLGSACARKPPVVTEPETVPRRGAATFKFLFDPSQVPALAEGQELESPRPVGTLALPEYPASALAAREGPATVIVRIVIDHDGRVADVQDSPKGASSAGPFAEDFRRAVEAAVRAWTFTRGEIRDMAPGNDVDGDGTPDYKVVRRAEAVTVWYDVRFDFAIVEGRPSVAIAPATPGS